MHPFRFCLSLFTALFAATAGAAQQHAVVLQYHHVADDTPAATSTRPEQFLQHLDYLARHRFEVMALPELIRRLRHGEDVPERAVALTFDDAHRSVCDHVFPLLRQRGLPFTVFVDTEPLDRDARGHCSWEQLREMGAAGVTLANHTVGHSHLIRRERGRSAAQWRDAVATRIEAAEQRIEAMTGQSQRLLAYPYGEFNAELKALTKELGFVALGQQSGPFGHDSDWQALPRFPMGGEYADMAEFGTKLASLPLPVTQVKRPDNPLPPSGRAPSVEMTLKPGDYPQRQLTCYASGQGRIAATWLGERRFRARAYRPLPPGRSRYNCTLPAGDGRYYWYSVAWVTADENGHWPE